MTCATSLTGTFDGLADGDVFNPGDGDWQINYDDTTPGLNGGIGTRFITVTAVATAVPEPSVSALAAVLCGFALLRRRR